MTGLCERESFHLSKAGQSSEKVDKISKCKAQKRVNLLEFFSPTPQAVWRAKPHFFLPHLSLALIYFCCLTYFSTVFSCNESVRIQIRKLQWMGHCCFSSWHNKDRFFIPQMETFPVMSFVSGKTHFVVLRFSFHKHNVDGQNCLLMRAMTFPRQWCISAFWGR